ncbi:MAG: LuxR C-terminal-related transcriptional regulator [Planctomycetota bacterium]
MIKAAQDSNTSLGIRPFMVVLRSERLSMQSLPNALPFQTIEVDNWEDVFRKLTSFRPGCLLIDLDSNEEESLGHIRDYADRGIRFSKVGVTADHSRKRFHQALRVGFIDVVTRPLDSMQLIEAAEEAFRVDSEGKESLCELRSRFGRLTPKELEILPHFLLGVPSRRLATKFLVTYQTIDRHRKRVIQKMNVENMNELAIKLYRNY